MRIVFCNKYFFLNGGVERYLYNAMNYLKDQGHTAIPFSVRYADSWPSPYEEYFLPPPGDPAQAHLANIKFSPQNLWRHFDRSTYSFEARLKLQKLLNSTGGADIAFIMNIYNYLSPSIIHTFRSRLIPMVMHIGDYNLVCPSYSLLRDGRPCTLCVKGEYYHGLKYRCVKNHLAASAVRVFAMYLHRLLGLYRLLDAIVVPCEFMRETLIEGGFAPGKIHLLPYPVERRHHLRRKTPARAGEGRRRGEARSENPAGNSPSPTEREASPGAREKKNQIVYFGRISYEKGLDTLLLAFQRLNPPVRLYLVGRSYDGEEERLKGMIEPGFRDRIHFPGFQSGEALARLIGDSLFSVVPSRWYDNAPLSVEESFFLGTPVLGSRIGGITGQIQEGVTGYLFEPDSVPELTEKMARMLSERERLLEMGRAGRSHVEERLLITGQMERLLSLFEAVIAGYRR